MSLSRLPLRCNALWFAVGLLPVPVIAQSLGTAFTYQGQLTESGQQRVLELRVRPGASSGACTILEPRQLVRRTPEGAGFALPRHVIAGGGGRSTGAAFAITGTIGQADADPLQPSSGGIFAITGGFWPGQSFAAVPQDRLFANGFEAQLP